MKASHLRIHNCYILLSCVCLSAASIVNTEKAHTTTSKEQWLFGVTVTPHPTSHSQRPDNSNTSVDRGGGLVASLLPHSQRPNYRPCHPIPNHTLPLSRKNPVHGSLVQHPHPPSLTSRARPPDVPGKPVGRPRLHRKRPRETGPMSPGNWPDVPGCTGKVPNRPESSRKGRKTSQSARKVSVIMALALAEVTP